MGTIKTTRKALTIALAVAMLAADASAAPGLLSGGEGAANRRALMRSEVAGGCHLSFTP